MLWKIIQTIALLGELAGFAGAYGLHVMKHERLSAIRPWIAVACLIFLVATDPNRRKHEPKDATLYED
jgi:hypothetical protein